MQTDTWLTDATDPDCCPLCSHRLAAGSNICPSCGFTVHEPVRSPSATGHTRATGQSGPITPIPARASALRSQGAAARSVSSQPAPFSTPSPQQARGLRHDSPSYEAVSSLSALSLIIAETPTAPPRTPARQRQTGAPIDEIDTVPQRSEPPTPGQTPQPLEDAGRALILYPPQLPVALPGIDEIDTVPEGAARTLQVRKPEHSVVHVTAASWTAGSSTALTRSAGHTSRVRRFSPLDRTRWWLLRPGHIEFLLWLAGSVLLFGITFLFLLALALSLLVPAPQHWGNFPSQSSPASSGAATAALTDGLHLQLTGSATLALGSELHLQGQGFRPASQISFWLDGRWPLLDQHGGPAQTRTDASGRFTVNLWLGQGAPWSAGQHHLLAREMDNGQQAAISISINAPQVTPVSHTPGPQGTPVPPVQPTPVPPTATPLYPTPTARPPTPVPSATAGITPTASPVGTNVPGTPTGSPGTVSSSSLGNDLHTGDGGSLLTRLLHLNPLVWVIGICYLLSMLFLGLAGVLHRRRR